MADAEREGSAGHLVSPSIRSGDGASVNRSISQTSHLTGDNHGSGRAGIGALGLSGVNARSVDGRHMQEIQRYNGPFSDYHYARPANGGALSLLPPEHRGIGLAITGDPQALAMPRKPFISPVDRAPSPTPSTPSIYPPSLPPGAETDDNQFYEKEMQRPPSMHPLRQPPKVHFNELQRQEAVDPFADPIDDLFYLESKPKVQPLRIDTKPVILPPGPLTPAGSTGGDSSVTTPALTQSSDSGHDVKSNPFAYAFLGRPVVGKIEPLTRPPRSPLRTPSIYRPST